MTLTLDRDRAQHVPSWPSGLGHWTHGVLVAVHVLMALVNHRA